MSFNIPESWLDLKLGDVINYGKTEKIEPNEIADDQWVLELEDIEKDTSRLLQKLTYAERQSKSTKNKFKKGDVLYGKLRPYLNKVLIADQDGCCTTEIIPIKSNDAINGRYLYYWLKHPAFLDYVADVSHGINMPRLGTDAGKAAPFVLAPINEQKHIADKLDTLLAAVDACRARLDNVPALIKRFRQSVLAAATSGVLTESWRSCNHATEWRKSQLSQVCESITDGDHQAPPQAENGIPFITISAINSGCLRLEKASRFVPENYYNQLKPSRKPALGDVLFSVTGSIAIPAIVNVSVPFTFQRHIAILKPDLQQVSSKFLFYSLGAENIKQQALSVATGTAQLTIPLTALRVFSIDLPDTKEQEEIVRRVEALFAVADKLEAHLATVQTRVNKLTPAILAQAFRGELVPQDPRDEPASVLLEKIANPVTEKRSLKKAA